MDPSKATQFLHDFCREHNLDLAVLLMFESNAVHTAIATDTRMGPQGLAERLKAARDIISEMEAKVLAGDIPKVPPGQTIIIDEKNQGN